MPAVMGSVRSAETRYAPGARRPLAALAFGLVGHVIVGAVCASSPEGHVGDFERYRAIATAEGRAYLDHSVEYPPGAVAVFTGLAFLSDRPETFNASLFALNAVADATIIGALAWGWGVRSAAFFTLASLPLLSLLYFRMDLWSTALATLSVLAWVRKRPTWSAGLLCTGAALKLWPLAFGALFLAHPRGPWTWRPVVVFAAFCLSTVAFWVWWSGADGVVQVTTFRGATAWDIESSIGSLWRALSPASSRMQSGALRVGWSLPLLSVALFALSAPPACWAFWKGATTGRLGTGWVAAVGALLSCSALVSPQFMGWLLPGAAIAWAEHDRRSAGLVVLLVAVTVTYRLLHTQSMPTLVVVRNVLLLATTVQALLQLAAQPGERRLA